MPLTAVGSEVRARVLVWAFGEGAGLARCGGRPRVERGGSAAGPSGGLADGTGEKRAQPAPAPASSLGPEIRVRLIAG